MAPAQSVFDLGEVVFSVNAAEIEQNRVGNSVTVITEEDLEKAGDLQLTEYLTRLPGVSLTQNGPQGGTADIRIRGAQGRYISVYIDGILVTDPSGTVIAYDDFGGMTTGSIRRIEVLRGSQSALYGGTAVGGVINISTVAGPDAPEGTTQTISAEAGSYNTYALSYGLTQRTGPLTLSFGIDHTRSDGFSAADENAGNTEADGFDRSRMSFGAAYAVTDALTLGLNAFVERGSQEFDEGFSAPRDGTPNELSERDATGLRTYLSFEAGRIAHEAALSTFRIRRSSFSDEFNSGLSVFEGRRLAFDYTGTAAISDPLQLTLGLSAMQEEGIYSNLPGGSQTVKTYGAFIEGILSPTDAFDLTGTLRYDDHSGFGGKTTGRLAFAWRPESGTVLRGAIGTGYRPPSLDELYGDYPDPNYPFQGNPNLMPEESLSLELGIDRNFAGGASLSATVFRLDIDSLVAFDACPDIGAPRFECQTGTFSTLENLPGTSTRRGVELSGSLPISETTTLTGAYTYTDAKTAGGTALALIPARDIALGINTEWGNGWSGNLTAQRIIGLIETDGVPLPDYTLVNASIRREITEGVEAYLRVHNLFDEQYQTRRGFGTSDRAFYIGLRSRF
jgi:vitamin B12 transporter